MNGEGKGELVVAPKPLTAVEIRAQVNLIQEIMKSVMKSGEHYGTIPGCGDKPTLFKPGAEKLLFTFRIATKPEIQDLSTPDEIRYRIILEGRSMATGGFLGSGVGECSSSEEKYKWRDVLCDGEWNDTPEDRRREKWNKGRWDKQARRYGDPYKRKQVRTNISDIANTILKMAKKRALVDLVLTITAASDIFTQDIEELPKELLSKNGNGGESKPPKENGVNPPGQKPGEEAKCEVCLKALAPAVALYSAKNFGRHLCRDHQSSAASK